MLNCKKILTNLYTKNTYEVWNSFVVDSLRITSFKNCKYFSISERNCAELLNLTDLKEFYCVILAKIILSKCRAFSFLLSNVLIFPTETVNLVLSCKQHKSCVPNIQTFFLIQFLLNRNIFTTSYRVREWKTP